MSRSDKKWVSPEVLNEVKKIDLLSYLEMYEPYELKKVCRGTYRMISYKNVELSRGKWCNWGDNGKGGVSALDFFIRVRGMKLPEAALYIADVCGIKKENGAIKPFKPVIKPNAEAENENTIFVLPEKNSDCREVIRYLTGRGIDKEIIMFCIEKGIIYEDAACHNAVFVGLDFEGKPGYAMKRSTGEKRFVGECSGSRKEYSFRLSTGNNTVHVFESAIDLLSYATLAKKRKLDWKNMNLISAGGVSDRAVEAYLAHMPEIKSVVIHFDNDEAGNTGAKSAARNLGDRYKVMRRVPKVGKDVNDELMFELNIIRENENGRKNKANRCGGSRTGRNALCHGDRG